MSLKQYISEKIEKQKDYKMLEQYEKTYTTIADQTKQLESDLFNFMRVKYPKLNEWLEQYLKDYKNFAVAVYKDKLMYRKANTSKRILDAFAFIDKQLEIINNFENNKVAEILDPTIFSKEKKEKAEEKLKEYLSNKNNTLLDNYCENKRKILKLGPTLNMANRPELFELYHTAQGLASLLQHKMRKCKLAYDEYSKFYSDCLCKYMTTKKDSTGTKGYALKGKSRLPLYSDKWTTSTEQVLLQQLENLNPETISMEAREQVEKLLSYSAM